MGTLEEKHGLRPRGAPRRERRFFYGWVIVAVMAIAGAVGQSLGTRNFGFFIKPMDDDLHFGRAVLGWAPSAWLIASAVTNPLVGWLVDRFGSRVLLASAAGLSAIALVGVTQVTQPWQLIALFAVIGLMGITGPGGLVNKVPVAKWFVRLRGRAIAFVLMGNAVGGVIFMPLTQLFIDVWDWRGAWIALAAIGAGVVIPLSLIFVRRQPEDMGLLPDGLPRSRAPSTLHDGARPSPARLPDEISWTMAEAIHSSTLWRITLAFSCSMLAMFSVWAHRFPHFADRGLDPRLISYAASLDAAAAGIGTLFMGLLVERFSSRFVGSASMLVLATGTFLAIIAYNPFPMFLSMGALGLGSAGFIFVENYLLAEYFGRQHLGSIRGAVMPFALLSGSVGTPLAGYVWDITRSYTSIWSVSIGLLIVAAILLVLTPPPRKRAAAAPSAAPTQEPVAGQTL